VGRRGCAHGRDIRVKTPGYLADDAAYDRPIFEVNGSPAARGCPETAIVEGLVGMIREESR
jgi:neutral ceramidase